MKSSKLNEKLHRLGCSDYVTKKYLEFYEKKGYLPKYFQPYNALEIIDICTTISTESGTPGHIGNVLIMENYNE